jgi:site-specific recombinase XerD
LFARKPTRLPGQRGFFYGALMKLQDAIEMFLDHRRRLHRSPDTLALYSYQLAAWLEWRSAQGYPPTLRAVNIGEMRAYIAYMTDVARPGSGPRQGEVGFTPRTIRSVYRTLRALWNFLVHEDDENGESLLLAHQMRLFRNQRLAIPPILREPRPAIDEACYRALLSSTHADQGCDRRDRAILELLWETGMRVGEIAGLRIEALNLVERSARIMGKGGIPGTVCWGSSAHAALIAYLRQRRGPLSGEVFRGDNSRNRGGPISANLVRCMLKRRAKEVGVALPPGAPVHGFRHAFARRARAAGATIEEVGELLRDNTPEVIRGYLGNDEKPVRALYRRTFGADNYDSLSREAQG